MSSIAVVIPTYRRQAAVVSLLQSLFAGTRVPDRVIVVDNDPRGSFDANALPADWPISIVRAGLGLNLAGARNMGWQTANADICFFLDDDNIVAKDALDALVRTMDATNCGLAAPVIYDARRPTEIWCGGVRRSWWTTRTYFLLRGDHEMPDTPFWPTDDMPNSLAIPSATLRAVDGFDDVNFPFHYDEGDIAQRIRRLGLETLVVRDAAVWHSGGTDSDPGEEMFRGLDLGGRRRVEAMAYARVFYHRRHSPSLQKVVALGLFVPIWYLLVALACLRLGRSASAKREVLSALLAGLLQGYSRAKA